MGSRALERSGHRVIAYDARGHGASAPAPDPSAYALRRPRRRPAARAGRARDRPRRARRRVDGRPHGAEGRARAPGAGGGPGRHNARVRPGRRTSTRRRWRAGTRSATACARAGWRASSPPTASRRADPAWRETLLTVLRQRLAAHEHPEAVADALRAVPRSRPFARDRGPRGDRRADASSSPTATSPTRAIRSPSGRPTPRRSRARGWSSRTPGSSPIAWQGGQLSAVIARARRREAPRERARATAARRCRASSG